MSLSFLPIFSNRIRRVRLPEFTILQGNYQLDWGGLEGTLPSLPRVGDEIKDEFRSLNCLLPSLSNNAN